MAFSKLLSITHVLFSVWASICGPFSRKWLSKLFIGHRKALLEFYSHFKFKVDDSVDVDVDVV